MQTVAEYVADFLAEHGIDTCFSVTGGGSIFLNDAIGHHPKIRTVYCHHEQACAMAAEGYARITNRPALVLVTTGPGGINALTGVFGAYTDSIPMLVISGQVKRATCMEFAGQSGLRQFGDQEVNIVKTIRGGNLAKYAVTVDSASLIKVSLSNALHYATTGRFGPCWVDIPIDVQSQRINPDEIQAPMRLPVKNSFPNLREHVAEVVAKLREAKRPVILAGSGVRLAGAADLLRETVRHLGIPVTTAWTAHDLIPTDHPCHAGRPGTVGDRAGNFAVQNSDLLIVLGSRLNLRQVSYNWENFAPRAFKVVVDIDSAELRKPTCKIDLPIVADCKEFLKELENSRSGALRFYSAIPSWLTWCRERVAKYPVVTAQMRELSDRINPYVFIEALFDCLDDDDVVVCGDGTACVVPFQVGRIKERTRLWTNSGCAAMGYDLPAAVGAAVARKGKRVVCLTGDGSIMLNLQELQTIFHLQLPIKIFVLNNDGYSSIRQTQDNFFGRRAGEGPTSGLTFPNFQEVAEAFGIESGFITSDRLGIKNWIDHYLLGTGPALVDVLIDPNQPFEPKISTRRNPDGTLTSTSLEDMAPFLSREELASNTIQEDNR